MPPRPRSRKRLGSIMQHSRCGIIIPFNNPRLHGLQSLFPGSANRTTLNPMITHRAYYGDDSPDVLWLGCADGVAHPSNYNLPQCGSACCNLSITREMAPADTIRTTLR